MNLRLRDVPALVAAASLFGACAVRAQAPFPDVPPNHWAAEAVGKISGAGIIKGYPQATKPGVRGASSVGYNGNKPVTRYELALTLWRFIQYVERAERQQKGTKTSAAPRSGPEAVKRLVGEGYLPKNTLLANEGNKLVTADQLADVMAQVVVRVMERKVPITPDSQRAPIARPDAAPSR